MLQCSDKAMIPTSRARGAALWGTIVATLAITLLGCTPAGVTTSAPAAQAPNPAPTTPVPSQAIPITVYLVST
jgi:hypothetical protein